MIRGLHAMFYSKDADAMRAFLRDKLGFPFSDVGEGWLIFDVPAADVGCHPSESNFHQFSFWTDDVEATVAALSKKGVVFTGPVENHGWGLATQFEMPDGTRCQLYQPLYEKRRRAGRAARATRRKAPGRKAAPRARRRRR